MIHGPYKYLNTTWFIEDGPWRLWLDIDSDPDPDVSIPLPAFLLNKDMDFASRRAVFVFARNAGYTGQGPIPPQTSAVVPAPTGLRNKENPFFATENHIKLAKADKNKTQFFGTIGGLPGPMPGNFYVNSEFIGGAASGPTLGSFPPLAHTIGFNTAPSEPIDNGDGTFDWEINSTQVSGRSYLSYSLADNNPDLRANQKVTVSYTVTRLAGTSPGLALTVSDVSNVDVAYNKRIVGVGQATTVSVELTIRDAPYSASVRVGVGTTTSADDHVVISDPHMSLTAAPPAVDPIVTAASYDNVTFTLSMNIDDDFGTCTVYWVHVLGPDKPTAAEIIAGTGTGVLQAGNYFTPAGAHDAVINLTDMTGDELHIVVTNATGGSTGEPSLGANTIVAAFVGAP